MKLLSSQAILLCAIAAVSPAMQAETVRIISPQTGTFDSASGWSQHWVSNESDPTVTLTAGRKDMAAAAGGAGIDLREGTAKSSVYTITTDGAWRVTGFDMTFRGNSATDPVTVTCGARTIVSSATEDSHLSVTNLSEFETASFTLSGNNQGITTSNFTVTLTPITPEAYESATIDMTTGHFSNSVGVSGQWRSVWVAESESPYYLWLASEKTTGGSAANMQTASDGIGLDLREGSANSATYILSTAGSYRVSGFELTFRGNSADNPVTVSGGGTTLTSSATDEQTLVVDNVPWGSKASFTLEGNNQGITTTSFKVRISPTSPLQRGVCVFSYTGSMPYSTVYRIPAVAYIPAGPHAGRLLAVNDYRPCGMDIGYGEVDLRTSVSDDGGYNWSIPANPVDANGKDVANGDGQGTPATSNENRDCGFGDPSIVADRETGELLMLGVCGRIPIGQATRAIPQGLATWTSTDGGDTWTQWKDITEDILTQLDGTCQYGQVDGLFFTAGRMVQSRYVKVGSHYRVYVVGGGRSASIPDTQCWVFYSDDFGKSWHILGDPMQPALTTGGSEPKCEELPDGSVLYSGRAGGGRTFNIFTYTDYESAEGFWDEACFSKMVTGAASCNGDALIVPVTNNDTDTPAYLLMQSIPQHPSSRVNVGINFKVLADGYRDFGTSTAVGSNWDGAYQVSQLGSAYSSLTVMPDGTIGFIYEEATFGKDYTEVYRNLTVEQITGGLYSYCPDQDYACALALTDQLVDGKLAEAQATYTDRTDLLDTLADAAADYHQVPSSQTYLHFNAALRAVQTNVPLQSSITTIVDTDAPAAPQLYDMLGRPVATPIAGHIYLSPAARRPLRL